MNVERIKDHVRGIAQISKQERYDAVTGFLDELGIGYRVQKLHCPEALGNIIVEFNAGETPKIVAGAHYDNYREITPGANDNAAACAILLELIEELRDTKKHIEFVFFDMEECGLIGSQQYYDENRGKIDCCLNFDMCGSGDRIACSATKFNPDGFHGVVKSSRCEVFDGLPQGDAYTFIDEKIPTLYIISSSERDLGWYRQCRCVNGKVVGGPPILPDFWRTMHQPGDTPDKINYENVARIAEFAKDVLALI